MLCGPAVTATILPSVPLLAFLPPIKVGFAWSIIIREDNQVEISP